MKEDDKKAKLRTEGETEVLAAIAAMQEPDRAISKRLHAVITTSAPSLIPRTWYSMPAYTNGSKIVCFFRSKQKFGERYMTLGFNDSAKLDDGGMWPIYFALTELTAAEEAKIGALVKKAVS
ncbi:MAG TPA: DUF1801 domain-containing protein [Candidatus Saccharimonadales bacterium]|nr:DUF1801 domain-containing protein [Candidatus Saccharimonadales bacterium]